jgi:SPOR domain
MYKLLLIILLFTVQGAIAQTTDSTGSMIPHPVDSSTVTILKDPRIDQLVRKQIEINEETTRDSRRFVPGWRIQVINSPDRSKVFAAKATILREFPDWKAYLLYQSPNYKLRVGNFKTQEEAEDAVKQISPLFPSGIYVIPDIIELKLTDLPKVDSTHL